jgi:diguanylate cyclase (GGDEF)-like protein
VETTSKANTGRDGNKVARRNEHRQDVEPDFRKDVYSSEKTIRRIFVGACVLQAAIILVVVTVVHLWGGLPRPMFVGYTALLMWGEVVNLFAFWKLFGYTRQVERNLRRKSFVDEMTGIFNYRYVEQRLHEEYQRTRRHGGCTSLLFLDLDEFKKVNDRFGHDIGNAVLRELAQLLLGQVRHSDVLARMGGDEFLGLLPETTRDDAGQLAHRLTDAVRNYRFESKDGRVVDFVRLSVGVAAYPDNGETMDRVVAAADHAVYRSKEKGGDTVTVSEEFFWTESPKTE